MNTNNEIKERYSRQLALKELGEAGQQKLLQAKVLVIGAGGLGCGALPCLAAAGVGSIGIIDDDIVALSNLHRQPLYSVNDIGLSKAVRAAAVLRQLNPGISITALDQRLTVANALALIAGYDVIVDGSDNFSTRYMVNDACVLMEKPLVYGAVSKFEGQVAVFNNKEEGNTRSVNYRDLFPQPPAAGEVANCAETGVLGVLPAIIGGMQANETIKLITGMGTLLTNRLLSYNALSNQVYELGLTARTGTRQLIPANAKAFETTNYDWLCGLDNGEFEIDTATFNSLKDSGKVLIADVREYGEQPVVNEFAHIHIPLASIAAQWPATENDTIIVFCQSGQRSLRAARLLAARFGNTKKIVSLGGGILQWKQDQSK
jgi:sulfur-carrier protein adenylyltransferase/sulfurtransferase